jgi:long-chain fatty acid transport protein
MKTKTSLVLTKELILLCICFVFVASHDSFGSGFSIQTQGAAAMGLSASVIAHSSSPSSIFFNPALINGLKGTQVELGTTLISPSRNFISDATSSEFSTEGDLFYPSTFFITHQFSNRVGIGMGVFNSFGLGTRWSDSWEGRYLATNSELTVFVFNPVISVKVTDRLSLAAGLDVLTLDATLEKKLNLGSFPDANQKFQGNGKGAGYNLGILYDLTKDISLGASYRSHINTEIEGTITHTLPAGSEPYVGPLFPNTSAETDLTLPTQCHFGVAYRGIQRLVLEADLHFEGWSSYQEQRITLAQPVAGVTSVVTPKNWKDSYFYSAGADYRLNESVSLLGGYLYSQNPIPKETFEPAIPDSNLQVVSVGTELRYKKLVVGLSYGYEILKDRRKGNSLDDNPIDGVVNPLTSANGLYKGNIHLLGMSAAFRF